MDSLVSIITPAFNSEAYIEETIQSVLNQTYGNWELLIVDDASADNTVKIVNRIAEKDPRIKLFELEVNSGAGIARNKAIEEAQGDFIAFLDADDLWKPEKLQKQLFFMEENNASVCYCSYELMDEDGNSLKSIVNALPHLNKNKMLKANYIGNLTGVYNAKILGKFYMPAIRKRQDWGLWLRCIEKSGRAYGINEVLASYRVRKDSISSNKFNLLKYNYLFYRKACKFGAFKSGIYLIRFLFEHFLVKSTYITKVNK
ncbi:glycosyltransferase [Flavobacteriaceae bacterium R38]|nr:glycosyltransferase [Flavobacteriaceae bacterium R38]